MGEKVSGRNSSSIESSALESSLSVYRFHAIPLEQVFPFFFLRDEGRPDQHITTCLFLTSRSGELRVKRRFELRVQELSCEDEDKLAFISQQWTFAKFIITSGIATAGMDNGETVVGLSLFEIINGLIRDSSAHPFERSRFKLPKN